MNENDEYAFPYAAEWGCQNGMTLRDYFAGKALVGVLSEAGAHDEVGKAYLKQHTSKHIAESSYILADAMLAARKS